MADPRDARGDLSAHRAVLGGRELDRSAHGRRLNVPLEDVEDGDLGEDVGRGLALDASHLGRIARECLPLLGQDFHDVHGRAAGDRCQEQVRRTGPGVAGDAVRDDVVSRARGRHEPQAALVSEADFLLTHVALS